MRIAGVNIPEKKHLRVALTEIHGIGYPRATAVLKKLKIDPAKKVTDMQEEEEALVRKEIEAYSIEGDLRRTVARNIKRLKDLKMVRGYRHSNNLPVRGQQTRTNARTRKGPRKTMGSGRVKLQKK